MPPERGDPTRLDWSRGSSLGEIVASSGADIDRQGQDGGVEEERDDECSVVSLRMLLDVTLISAVAQAVPITNEQYMKSQ